MTLASLITHRLDVAHNSDIGSLNDDALPVRDFCRAPYASAALRYGQADLISFDPTVEDANAVVFHQSFASAGLDVQKQAFRVRAEVSNDNVVSEEAKDGFLDERSFPIREWVRWMRR